MDFDELKKQAENLAHEHPTEVDAGITKAAGLLKDELGHGDQIDEVTTKLEGFLKN